MSWRTLPTELKYSVVESLSFDDVKNFATVNHEAYTLAIPTLFKVVQLTSSAALIAFATNVPPAYCAHVKQLSITTEYQRSASASIDASKAMSTVLGQCYQVEHLSLHVAGFLKNTLITHFQSLTELRHLSISNCGTEDTTPLSERLVVSIAASVPNLTHLTLDRVSRSVLHAPELVGRYALVPVVVGDEDIPTHPLLGDDLALPSILRLAKLRYLRIRDTHLGDPRWSTTPKACPLEVLDLGSCYHESPGFNRVCTERILGNVGDSVDEFSLNTPLTDYNFTQAKDTPLKRLRKLHITPLVPIENVVDTLSTLSGSPVERLSVACHEDDIEDMCVALEDFLTLRVERHQESFYPHLSEISVHTVGDDLEIIKSVYDILGKSDRPAKGLAGDQVVAVQRLREYFQDLSFVALCPPKLTLAQLPDSCAIMELPSSEHLSAAELVKDNTSSQC